MAKTDVPTAAVPKAKPAKRRPAPVIAVPAAPPPAPAATPPDEEHPVREPLWLVRVVFMLFLVGFAAFLAREARGLLDAVEVTRAMLYWSGLGLGVLLGTVAGAVGAAAVLRTPKP